MKNGDLVIKNNNPTEVVFAALDKVRWILNAVFIATPVNLLNVAMIITNIVLMIVLNRWWAQGNFLLLWKTFYLIVQTMFSWPVLFELDFLIKRMKPIRWIALASAVIYMIGTIVTGGLYFYYVDFSTWHEKSLFVLWLEMMFLYNFLMDLMALPVNLSIIIKEATMACFQCFKRKVNTSKDKMSLQPQRLSRVFWFLNPIEVGKWIMTFFTKPMKKKTTISNYYMDD